jgi:hypothetical protein
VYAPKSLGKRRLTLVTGLVTALAALGLATPLTTATAQTNSRVCGTFWYTQVPDPTNDNKPTWFTLGVAYELEKSDSCDEKSYRRGATPDIQAFRRAYPDLPLAFNKGERWVASKIDDVTCEDFAKYIAQPPHGETITGRGQNWPAGDPDPCQSWTRNTSNLFWFKHL